MCSHYYTHNISIFVLYTRIESSVPQDQSDWTTGWLVDLERKIIFEDVSYKMFTSTLWNVVVNLTAANALKEKLLTPINSSAKTVASLIGMYILWMEYEDCFILWFSTHFLKLFKNSTSYSSCTAPSSIRMLWRPIPANGSVRRTVSGRAFMKDGPIMKGRELSYNNWPNNKRWIICTVLNVKWRGDQRELL